MLHEFITTHRDEIITRCRAKVALRSSPLRASTLGDHGVPVFLDQLVHVLRHGSRSDTEIGRIATLHGRDLLSQGFSVSEVVHDYGDVCQSITDLAVTMGASVSAHDFRTLNQCLDDAIAGAVTEYGRQYNQSGIDEETARGSERLGFLAHELRNLIQTALVAFEVIKTGDVGVGGSTGAVLYRSLVSTRDLISRSLTEVRLTQGVQHREHILVNSFIQELAAAGALAAAVGGHTLSVLPVEEGIQIEADRQLLAAVVTNLLQNAFKFSRPRSTVTLRVGASVERVLIEVEDQCGGFPGDGEADALFRPFEQRGADRTGLGLGLAFSRWAVEANHGRLYARNLPHKGCVFTVDLRRLSVRATA